MTDKETNRYPSNQAYISKNNNSNRYMHLPNNSGEQSMRASVLAERVHDLQEQLVSIATALNEDGRENKIWQQQLMKQHNQLTQTLEQRQKEIQSLKMQLQMSENEKKQLKNSLFQQNQQFQNIHKQIKEIRNGNSRINGKQLEQKVLQLNDQISSLLVKIQQLIQENNQHITYIQDLQRAVEQFKANQEVYKANIQRLNDENNYLKEQIKEVENMNIYQQTEIQNNYIQQLEEAKLQIETLRSSRIDNKKAQVSPKKAKYTQVGQHEKQNNKLKDQIHNLEEELLQQRQIERSVKKKYQEKLNLAEAQVQKLNEQVLKLKQTNRKLQNQSAEKCFALEQFEKQKKDSKKIQSFQSEKSYKNIIMRLESQKEELNLKLNKAQIQIKYQHPTQLYPSLLRETELKLQRLKEQLEISQVELFKSKNAVREYSELAKRWEEDYRVLAQSFEQDLAMCRQIQQRNRNQKIQFEKQKDKYCQTVRKFKVTEQLYKEIEEKLRIYEQAQSKSSAYYDKESSDLIKLQNSALKQQISELKYEISQLKHQLSTKVPQMNHKDIIANDRELEFYKQRQRELQREVNLLRIRLNNQINNSKETDLIKIRELNDQLTRVNRMLNQREMELDSFKEKYTELQSYLNKKQEVVSMNRHHPQYTRLKNQFVILQRKLMETQLYYKNNIQNANYEIESLKVQNMHHRKKIEQLVSELSNERSSLDYGKINRSLQLSQLKIKQLQKQLQFSQLKIKQLSEQLRKLQSRSRKNSEQLQNQVKQSKNAMYLNSRDYLQHEVKIHNLPISNTKQSYQINGKKEQYSSSSYDQILKWKQEIKQSRTNFSKKWANQFSADHVENSHLWYPVKEQISS